MGFQIIDKNGERYSKALLYTLDGEKEFLELEEACKYLEKKGLYIISDKYDKYGKEKENFQGVMLCKDVISLIYIEEEDIDLEEILTLSEAAKKWGLSDGSTIRKAIERGKFKPNEIKQAGAVWVTTYKSMTRVFGEEKRRGYTVDYKEFTLFLRRLFYKDSQNEVARYYIKGDQSALKLGKGSLEKELKKRVYDDEITLAKYVKDFREVILKGEGITFTILDKDGEKVIKIINSKEELIHFINILEENELIHPMRKKEFF